ncbi:MAG: VCBS repeat-containing protein [Phycisphaerales bacterium]|nr:VCBS repeat-containing protein [Phycisphaerales bacterium]
MDNKTNISWRFLLASLVMLSLLSQSFAQLSYVERSIGLEEPDMENGRTEIELSDVNGDGHVDIVSVGDHGSPYFNATEHGVMVWFGDGAGQWSLGQTGNFGYGGVAIGDVNGDGFADVGYGVHHNYSGVDLGNQILEVALGNGSGLSWTPWDDGLAANGETWGMFGTDFADVDCDGDLDVGSVGFGCCAGLHVYLNNGDGTWTQSWGFLGGNSDQDLVFGEINGDGYADLVSGHGSGTVYFGNGAGGFTLADSGLPDGPQRYRVALGDVNGDGRDDLVYIKSGAVKVYAYQSDDAWHNLTGNLPQPGGYDFAQIADMDLDGHGDVVLFRAGNSSPGFVDVYGGDGAGNWTQLASFTTANNDDYAAFRAGVDLDHNGLPDVAVVQEEYVGGLPIAWRNRPRVYVETTTPSTPSVFHVYPRGGETFVAGAVHFLRWHAAVPDSLGNPTVTIELSTTGPSGPFVLVAADIPNSGRYQWTVPGATLSSDDCYLRLTVNSDPSASAVTPGAFGIFNPDPTIPGDLDGDGDVDQADLGILLASYEIDDGGDIDGDGDTDQSDLGMLLANYGQPCP